MADAAHMPMPHDLEVTIARAVGAELRRLRLRAGMTQADVERMSGIQRPIVCRAERGMHVQSLVTCARLAKACGAGLGHVLLAVDQALGSLP